MTIIITNAIITAYCSCALCCGKANQPTASGKLPVQGTTIAAPRSIKLGTHVIINGHEYIVQDRTAKRYDGRWDVYFNKHSDAKRFGIRTNRVEVVK